MCWFLPRFGPVHRANGRRPTGRWRTATSWSWSATRPGSTPAQGNPAGVGGRACLRQRQRRPTWPGLTLWARAGDKWATGTWQETLGFDAKDLTPDIQPTEWPVNLRYQIKVNARKHSQGKMTVFPLRPVLLHACFSPKQIFWPFFYIKKSIGCKIKLMTPISMLVHVTIY